VDNCGNDASAETACEEQKNSEIRQLYHMKLCSILHILTVVGGGVKKKRTIRRWEGWW